jgi:hypothetical protein
MASSAPPAVDSRTATDIAGQVYKLLAVYAPAWKQVIDPVTGEPKTDDPLGAALIAIFSRFAEIIIQRLNQVPDKNFLAFLDLLGEARLPPQPAQVPLTFSLASGSAVDAVVPAGTQVAAPPAEGETAPVIFETERELVVTAAQWVSLFTREPEQDRYADYSALLTSADAPAMTVFQGDRPIEHSLYLGHETLLGYPQLQELRLAFTLASEFPDPDLRSLQWEIWDGAQGIPLTPTQDTTASLTKNGEVVFNGLKQFPEQTVNALPSRWLRCRLLTPITLASDTQAGRVRVSQLPDIQTLTAQVTLSGTGLVVETAFTNQLPVDLSKDFFPFGEKPKFGDTLYLARGEAFAEAGSVITLHIELTNPSDFDPKHPPPIPPTNASGNPTLTWEFWDGRVWIGIGTSPPGQTTPAEFDTTAALTKSGTVSFTLPSQPAVTTVNGMEKYWIRVRISAGNYGEEAHYEPVDPNKLELGYKFIPATFAPPSIRSLTIDYTLTKAAALPEWVLLSYNDFAYNPFTSTPFKPFQPTLDTRPTLYLGFTLPAGHTVFPNRNLSLYLRVPEVKYGETAATTAGPATPAGEPLRLTWEYWNGQWSDLRVQDGSENFTRSDLLEWLAPADLAVHAEFGLPRYWVRVRWESGEYRLAPRLSRMLLNTTLAVQAVTLRNEILGSSDGSENQRFNTTRTPILDDQQLEVREPELPPAEEQAIIMADEGEDAITVNRDATGSPVEIWVRWHPVPDFYGSGPRDRHYVLDHLSGEIRFGDSRNGLIPPVGTGNIRMASYRIGGGDVGNRAADTLIQLKTTVPYVDKVTNPEPAAGGAEAESQDSLLRRAPRALRHRHRAVSLEDYEDVALLASPGVARTKCIPLYDLVQDPDAKQSQPGTVSLIIVPLTTDSKPVPSLELLDQVQSYLDVNRIPTADLVLVGPEYIRVDVEVDLALVSPEGASTVERDAAQALARFLHPLTGGLDQTGWDFGRAPHSSDLYALLEAVPGVDHIRGLQVTETEERPGALVTGRFLVYSGQHSIHLTFVET